MNYNGNMPDWHQYNPLQSGINDVASTAQNVNSGHLPFISSISPTQLNSLNLGTEGHVHEKHQNDPNFNPRHFQPHLSSNISHGHNAANNTPLASMVQMQNCISHYGHSNTRNPMVDNLNGPIDSRNTAIGGINEELGYRNNQVPLNGPISHLNGPNVINMNIPHGSVGPRSTNVNSHATSRAAPPPFVPCKGLCCNPDPNIGYQWEKYCSYQNNTTYRENIRSSGYQADARRFGNDFNFRKDNFDSKEALSPVVSNASNADHRRNFSDFKYRKDRLLSRSYPSSSGILQNYPVQNYSYAGEYQKYPYNVKDYSKVNSLNIPNQGMVKHQEQGFMAQQKYNNKQISYQNSGMMLNNMPSTSINSNMIPSQNTYFNPQYSRNLSTETSHDCQETTDNISMANRMQTSAMHTPHPRYQVYQQKIAMERFSMENRLREFTKIPGYQSYPKYKECVLKYKEILKLQQSVTYQGQLQQTSSCVATSTINTSSVPPINLQFDQNGILINSSYIPEAFPRVQQTLNPQTLVNNLDKQNKQEGNSCGIPPERMSHNVQKPNQKLEQLISQQHIGTHTLCPENLQKQDRYSMQKSLDQNQFEVQKMPNESFNNLNANADDATMQQKISKTFADKPELDVRQFLANWDESEDEDSANSNMPDIILTDSTPVVVVGYENLDLSTKTLSNLEGSKPDEISSSIITFENQDKNNTGAIVPTQDCLTISYSSAENIEIAKNVCKEVSKESIAQPSSSIIQCISNGPDEVPTIHIVDNLEISGVLQVTSEQMAKTLERQEAVSFFHEKTEIEMSGITNKIDKFNKKIDGSDESTDAVYSADLGNLNKEKKYIVESPSPPKTIESISQTSQMSNQSDSTSLSTSTKSNLNSAQNIDLKKQSSFTSEESHHPDDISLPDLPTSECTPISTTLNTPIHSDSEEASERVESLTISTNPIEVIQNSPMISFTQSPVRGEPYDHLNDEDKNKSVNSYRRENQHFKDNESNDMLDHDAVLSTFEFSTSIDKNKPATITKNNSGCLSPSGNTTSINNDKAFSLDSEIENAEATGMCMTLTSGEYELKIMSTHMQNSKSTQDYKNSTTDCHANESQAIIINQDTQMAHKKLQILPESTGTSAALQCGDSIELDKTLRNIADNSSNNSVERDAGKDNVDYAETNEAQLLRMFRNKERSYTTSSDDERKCSSTELIHQIKNSDTMNSSPTNDATSRNSKSAMETNSSMKIVKNNPTTSHNAKLSISSSNKLKRSETSDKCVREDSLSERDANELLKTCKDLDKDSEQFQHVNRLMDHKRLATSNQTNSHNKQCLSENTAEKDNETTVHHNKHTREVAAHKSKFYAVKSHEVRSEKKTVDKNNDDRERMRLLKEYRKMKYKSSGVEESQGKSKDTQEISDCKTSKKCHLPSSSDLDERVALQLPMSDKQLCHRNVRFKSSEEPDKKHAILKTFVSKNMNPDFAIQVTNVNLKLKDDDPQTELQRSREEAKSASDSLDAIKIEINVSCRERSTTEKLLHENIKNAVAETIGHLTSSISNGARSNSTSLAEIQYDKKTSCDKVDHRDCERYNQSPSASTEASAYNESCKDQNAEVVRQKSAIASCKDDAMNDETSGLFILRKRNSSSGRESMNNTYKENGNVEIEPTSSALETSKLEHIRKGAHKDTEKQTNPCTSIEELKVSSDNSSYMALTLKRVNTQKKEHEETAFLHKNARNSQDSIAFRSNAGPSICLSTVNPCSKNISYDYFDYNHFDVAPNENADVDDRRTDTWKRPKKDDDRFTNFDFNYETASGYINPIFFNVDELENLNTVPVYTTKDGKITYSPNPRFTYRELIMEARAKEGYDNTRELYFARSPSYDYYNCSKLRKVFKRNRDIITADRKKETDSIDTKSQMRHIDYMLDKTVAHKSAHCAKIRGMSHLEFFNDDAGKLYTSRNSHQKGIENNNKSIIDLSFLEKQCKSDSEVVSNVKYCKTKIFTDNFDYEQEYNDISVFEPSLFLGPKTSCWEETMESVKSYCSHINRRSSDNLKELDFSEIFAAQKRLDSSPFLSTQQSSSGNNNHKMSNSGNMVVNEPTSPRTTCSYINNLHLIQDGGLLYEQSDTIPHDEQANENNNVVLTTDNKSMSTHNTSYDEYAKKQQIQREEVKSSTIELIEKAKLHSPEITDEKTKVLEENQCSKSHQCSNYMKDEALTNLIEDKTYICCTTPLNPDKSDVEETNAREVLDESSAKDISPLKSSADFTNLPNEPECIQMVRDSSVFALNNQADKNDDLTKDNSDLNDGIVYQQTSLSLVDRKNKEEKEKKEEEGEEVVLSPTKSNVLSKIYFDKTNERDDDGKENSVICKEKESVISQNPSNIVSTSQSLEESNEQELRESEDEKQLVENSLKDQERNKADDCDSTMTSEPTIITLNLHPVRMEANVCDIFASVKRKQNISEFTVIKSIIKDDNKRQQCQRSETKDNFKDCDSIIDPKLLCMDSSDCGIYTEDRCALTQISEHDFTEDDSLVPMEWETSQIQEDAVNRLCNIDETSIDFASAANTLQNNSLLDNFSFARSTVKESGALEATFNIECKSNEPMSVIESSAPPIEKSKKLQCNDEESKEQNQISSSSYEKLTYLHATDCNANTKMVPKLVIKKTEASMKFVTKMNSSSIMDNIASKPIFRPNCQPKIPKMIIRNARSRPGTPSIEAVPEDVSAQVNITDHILFVTRNEISEESYKNDSEGYSLQETSHHRNKIPKMKIKLDEKHSNKIIRVEDTAELCVKRKNLKKTIPKVKIKNSPGVDRSDNSACNNTISQESKDSSWHEEKIPILKLKKQERNRSSSPEVMRKRQNSNHPEVPVKKCKMLGRNEIGYSTRYGNPDSSIISATECETKKNPLVCISEKIPKVIIKRTSASAEFKCELSKSCKSIIAKSAKWQPEVKLERYRILDSMVRNLKSSSSLTPISLQIIDKIFASRKDNCRGKEGDDRDPHKLSRSNSTSDLLPIKCKQRRMSDYDCRKTADVLRDNFSFMPSQDMAFKDMKTCIVSRKSASTKDHNKLMNEGRRDGKWRSKSRDNNLRAEASVTSFDKEADQSVIGKANLDKVISQRNDKYKTADHQVDIYDRERTRTDKDESLISTKKNIFMQHSSSTNFKSALKELKATSKIESCFVKLPDLSGTSLSEKIDSRTGKKGKENKERDNDPFSSNDDCKVAIKKEPSSSYDDTDNNECTLQEDASSLKTEDPADILDNFEVDKSTVIKIESSDESQTTIEILPVSPAGSHSELENNILEDGDSEQLYPADAIPTQFELELEITDNSNVDLLDVPMPKLGPVTCYNPRSRMSIEEYCSKQTSKIKYYDKSELLAHSKKNFSEKIKHVEIDIGSDRELSGRKSAVENLLVDSVRNLYSKVKCSKQTDSTRTKESFCCNDSLIKEVLAAKETLKKCFSKSRCESDNATSENNNNSRPKTAAEKKQGSSFDLNNFSETKPSKSSGDAFCFVNDRNDVTFQTGSTPMISSTYNRETENTINSKKSDEKHSKPSKGDIFVKKKFKLPEKKDVESCSTLAHADSKGTTNNAHECTTISLKAFKRFGQATSNENTIYTVNPNGKSPRRKKSLMDRNNVVPHLRDSPLRKKESVMSFYKIPKTLKSTDQENNNSGSIMDEIKTKEDNMPILEPAIAVDFNANSDRDNSRSPPVITNQDSGDISVVESKLVDNKVITSSDKVESDDMKDVHKKSEMSITDFVTQLAYHEKATIKHRRYCNLCERWFPTTSRHRRHLAGYQHRHIELTQRRSIHALFMLFTGKPCPRLLPANVVRNDCSVGELTPLQIVVQDVTKSFAHTQQNPKKQNNVDK